MTVATDTVLTAYYAAFHRADWPAFLDPMTEDVIHDINQGGVSRGVTPSRHSWNA